MKATLGAEAIGLGYERASTDLLIRNSGGYHREVAELIGVKMAGNRVIDPINLRPWVAEIVGRHPRWRYRRVFLQPKVDYSRASSTANRGVWFWWTLESGHIYEASYRTSWSSGRVRRFITVTDDGDIADRTEEEVQAWLNVRSASTS